MRISLKFLRDAFTVLVLFLGTGAFISMAMDTTNPDAATDGSMLTQLGWSLIYIVVLVRAVPLRRQILRALKANKALLFLVLLAILSTAWSANAGLTVRRGFAVAATTLFGIDFAVRYSIREQVRLFGIAIGAAVAISVVVELFFHGLVPTVDTAYPDAWNGAFVQKNEFARFVVLAGLLALMRVRHFAIATAIVGVSVGLIVLCHSKTALVVFTAMLLLLVVFFRLRRRGPRALTAAIAGVLIVSALLSVVVDLDSMAGLLGRDATQTGRTNIDGSTTTFGGGCSQISVASAPGSTGATTLTLPASVPAVKGAAAYAWFLGTSAGGAANAALTAITTTNSVVFTAAGIGAQKATDGAFVSADSSQNFTEFDGFLTVAAKASSGAYSKSLDGLPLTSDGASGIVEIDAALQSFWDNARLSPNEIWVHSQEARNINKRIVGACTSSLVRFTTQETNEPFIMGGTSVAKYWNKFTAQWIDLNIHPSMPAGTMLFKTNEIPYPMAEVGAVNLVRCRRDYYQIEWPFVSRQYVYGVYTDEVLVCRAPLSLGVIANIANG